MTQDKISSRIEILRFPLIVAVVFIHNYATSVNMAQGSIGVAQNNGWVQFVRSFISEGLARVAVPLFFIVAGYLFFLGEWSWRKYASKLKRRIHTLLIPLLFWNAITLAACALAESIPQTKIYVSNVQIPPIGSFSLFDYVNAFLGLTTAPISYPFWFIRDLIALVLLAPCIHFLLAGRSAIPFVVALFTLWCLGTWPLLWPNLNASFFFVLGAFLAQSPNKVLALDKLGPAVSILFLVLVTLECSFPGSALYHAMILCGVPSAWWLTRIVADNPNWRSSLLQLSKASFFVFAAHEPLLTILRKVFYKELLPTSGATIIALYFLIPIFLIAFLVLVYRGLSRTFPGFLGTITGSARKPWRETCHFERA